MNDFDLENLRRRSSDEESDDREDNHEGFSFANDSTQN